MTTEIKIPTNHKGGWCPYLVAKRCLQGYCQDCAIYQSFLNGKLEHSHKARIDLENRR